MADYCGSCGQKLASKEAKICVKCGAEPARATFYCTSCGAGLKSANAKMCVACGAGLSNAAPKEPGIAALLAVVGMILLGAPAIGYLYLGKMKKGVVYLVAGWVTAAVVAGLIVAGQFGGFAVFIVGWFAGIIGAVALGCPFAPFISVVTMFAPFASMCCVVLAVIPVILDFVIIYDVYLEASGKKPLLPAVLKE